MARVRDLLEELSYRDPEDHIAYCIFDASDIWEDFSEEEKETIGRAGLIEIADLLHDNQDREVGLNWDRVADAIWEWKRKEKK